MELSDRAKIIVVNQTHHLYPSSKSLKNNSVRLFRKRYRRGNNFQGPKNQYRTREIPITG